MDLERILGILDADPRAADVCLCFFIAAANSFKIDTVLRPFPPSFVNENGEKDYEGLQQACGSLPDVQMVRETRGAVLDDHQVELLHWVLTSLPFTLNTERDKEAIVSKMRDLTGCSDLDRLPSEIISLSYNESASEKFELKRASRDLLYGFHGTKVFNVYSIMKNGFISYMTTTCVFGEGTYLSEEPSVALNFAPKDVSWRRSMVGSSMSVCAFCEIIDDPGVKGQSKSSKPGSQMQKYAPRSQSGAVPEKYLVVTDNELLRIKYLLIYAENPAATVRTPGPSASPAGGAMRESRSVGESFWRRNRFWLVMLFYMCLLVVISLYNSKRFWVHFRKVVRSALRSANIMAALGWEQ